MPKSTPQRSSRKRAAAAAPAESCGTGPAQKKRGRPRTVVQIPPAPTAPGDASASLPPILEVNHSTGAASTTLPAQGGGDREYTSTDVFVGTGSRGSVGETACQARPTPILSVGVTDTLGFQVPLPIKEKIWAGAYVDLATLVNDTASGMVLQPDHQSLILASDGDQVVLRPANPGRKRIESFGLWQSTFHTFMSIYLQQHTHRYAELLKYCEVVRTASIQFGGMGWKMYDQQFRLKQERTPSRSWAEIDMELWVTVASGPAFRTPSSPAHFPPPLRKQKFGHCFAFNDRKGCHFVGCRYTHACNSCTRPGHGAFQCTVGRSASQANARSANFQPRRLQIKSAPAIASKFTGNQVPSPVSPLNGKKLFFSPFRRQLIRQFCNHGFQVIRISRML